MTRFILVRHGETDWNREGRYQGHADIPLNERGLQQAMDLAQKFESEDFHAVYASDLSRASKTAQVIAQPHSAEVRIDPRLREIDQGDWEGLVFSEIQDRFAEAFEKYRDNPLSASAPNGETVLQVRTRVLAAMEDIRQNNPDKTVLVISHGFVLALLLVHFRQLPIEQIWGLIPQNVAITELIL